MPTPSYGTQYTPGGGVNATPSWASPEDLQGQALGNATTLAKIQAEAQKYGYDTGLAGTKYGADTGLKQTGLQTEAQKYGFNTQLAGQKYSSDAQKQAALGVAGLGLQGTQYSSDAAKQAAMYGSDAAKAATLGAAAYGLQGTQYSSDAAKQASMFGATSAKEASEYGANKQFQGQQYVTDAQMNRFNQAFGWSKDKFGQVMDFLNNHWGGLGGTAGGPGGYPSPPTGAPGITTGGVLTPGQIQANVNSVTSGINQKTAAQNYAVAQSAAGRGAAGSMQSPLAQALMRANTSSGIGQAANAELGYRTNASQANAQQNLASQQAAFNAWQQTQGLGLQGQKNMLDYNASLINALSGLAGTTVSSLGGMV